MTGDRPPGFLIWMEEKRKLATPPSDAGREYALDSSGWKVKPFELPYQKRNRIEPARKMEASRAVAPREELVKAAGV